MTTLATNAHVTTALGPGTIQGRTAAGWLVRIAVTDANRAQLSAPNCWTPRTTRSGLWIFPESELANI